MFGRKKRMPACATIVSATFVESKGSDENVYDFVIDVTPADGAPFRGSVRQRAHERRHPKMGDDVRATIDRRDGSVMLDLDDPRFQPQAHADTAAFNERYAANVDEVHHLAGHGLVATATLTRVEQGAHVGPQDQREFLVTADVQPSDGDPFAASFAIFDSYNDELHTPAVGQSIGVLIAPTDRSIVRAAPLWATSGVPTLADEAAAQAAFDAFVAELRTTGQRVIWRVPDECPNCGHAVDQSVESMAEHPRCHTCGNPLPCEPYR